MAASKKTINSIFALLKEQEPEPQTELEFVNHYTLLVAVVLSAQATDKGVNKATKALFAKVQTPEEMVALGLEGLREYIKTIGLYPSKSKNVIALSEQLIALHDSEVPEDFKALLSLPGVGEKTANVVLNCAFGHPTIPVDTHVHRLANRLGFVNTKMPAQTAKLLPDIIPAQWLDHAHHWMILHGRYVCKARRPLCEECILTEYCEFFQKDI